MAAERAAGVRGHIVVFEGNQEIGFSAYSPDLPGVVATAAGRHETEELMLQAMAKHIELLKELGLRVPEPADIDSVTLLDPAVA
jgi:predicted RNase H-like HicB family nuclease